MHVDADLQDSRRPKLANRFYNFVNFRAILMYCNAHLNDDDAKLK